MFNGFNHFFLRHGQAENIQNVCFLDAPLDATHSKGFGASAEYCSISIKIAHIYSSPIERAHETYRRTQQDNIRRTSSFDATKYEQNAKEAYGTINGSVSGYSNEEVATQSDVLVLSIPYENIDAICPELFSKTKKRVRCNQSHSTHDENRQRF